jgi:hypothetical protein
VLPAGWDAIEVERVWIGDDRARLTAKHGDRSARLSPDRTDVQAVRVAGAG